MSESDFEEIKRRIKAELEPFFDNIITKKADFESFRSAYNNFETRFVRAWNIFSYLLTDFLKAPAPTGALFTYLGCVESLGNCIVDIVVMLLVANGRDFHIECRYTTPRIKHVKSIEDLEKEQVPLTTKLNFLRDNGVEELPSIVDSALRNDIAHLNFDVREDGIYIREKLAKEVLSISFGKLVNALHATETCLRDLAMKQGFDFQKGVKEGVES